MKYIKHINEISGYDSWKTQSPYDNDTDCLSSGEADFDITFNIDKSANSDAIDAGEFNSFVNDVESFLTKYFKKYKQLMGFKVYTPLNAIDDSYVDWAENEDGSYTVGSMAFKITGDFDDVEASPEDLINAILPGEKQVVQLVKKYKWIDLKRVWIENIDSEIDSNCE